MAREEIKEKISKNRALLKEKYNVKSIGIFGSFRDNSFDKDSDIDILVEFSKTPDIFEFIKLEEFLSELPGLNRFSNQESFKTTHKRTLLKETIYI